MLAIGKKVGRGGQNVPNDVMLVQVLLNANLNRMPGVSALTMDGKSGKKTIAAITKFQEIVVKLRAPDGRVDPGGKTIGALVQKAKTGAPRNMSALFEKTRFQGQARQMKIGRITVNNSTYYFTCGGHGRGNIPTGKYEVTAHMKSRSGTSYSSDGVGYSFALSDKWDSRAFKKGATKPGDTRELLRIHPDGGVAGTKGCIGILGAAQTQRSFRTNMYAELKKGGKAAVLTVR